MIPTAATTNGTTSPTDVHGNVGFGKPLGNVPTVAIVVRQPEHGRNDGRTHHRDEHRRDHLRHTREHEEHDEHRDADDECGGLGLVEVLEPRGDLAAERGRVGGEPAQLRQLTHDDRDRETVHVADLDLARQQIGDEPEPAQTRGRSRSARQAAQASPRARRRSGTSPGIASGTIAAKISGDTEESGPSTRTRDGPKSA